MPAAGICYNITDMNGNLKTTLKAWPVITVVTISLCYITQLVADLFGIKLPDQAHIDLVRKHMGWNIAFILLCTQVLLVMPAIEELIFRWLLFRLPRPAIPIVPAITSSVLFSAAHYITQPFPDAAFVALFFFGLAQCWLYKKTDRIWCPMLNHSLFNLTNIVLLFFILQQ